MIYTLTDATLAAFKAFELHNLTSSAQLFLLHLLYKDNCLGRTGRLEVTDEEMRRVSGLSKATVTDAKRRLKNTGLIDFKSDKKAPQKGTRYELLFCQPLGQKVGQKVGQVLGQKVGQASRYSPLLHLLNKREREEAETRATAAVGVIAEWEQSELFCPLDGELKGELQRLIDRHGEDTIRSAMRAAKFANGSKSINFNYFMYKLNELLKGGKAVVRTDEAVQDECDAPWTRYLGSGKVESGGEGAF